MQNTRRGLKPLEYIWLLLPAGFAFFTHPLVSFILASLCLIWAAGLLFQRARGDGYFRAIFMTSVMMIMWMGLSAFLTYLANGFYAGLMKNDFVQGHVASAILMLCLLIYGLMAALAAKMLGIGSWRDCAALFAGCMIISGGAVANGAMDSSWLFPAGVLAASGLIFTYLRLKAQ